MKGDVKHRMKESLQWRNGAVDAVKGCLMRPDTSKSMTSILSTTKEKGSHSCQILNYLRKIMTTALF